MEVELISPNGKKIVGTYDKIPAIAFCRFNQTETDLLEIDYDGESRIQWDDQYTVSDDEKFYVVDEDDNIWRIDDVKIIEKEVAPV